MGQRPRLLLITRYYPPLDSIASLRMFSWAKYLHRRGWQVDVLTTDKCGQVIAPLQLHEEGVDVCALPYFDPLVAAGVRKTTSSSAKRQGSIFGALKRLYQTRLNERMPGRTDLWVPPATRELRRRHADGIQYDYVISSYGPPSAHIVGARAKKIFGATWIADYRDLWLENHCYKGVWPVTLAERWLERRVVSQADMITTVSDGLAQVLASKFPQIPVHVVCNGFDPEIFPQVSSITPEKVQILYTGSIYANRRDPTPLFRAVRRLHERGKVNPNQLEILFYGSCQGNLCQIIDREQAGDYARYCGSVSGPQSLELQAKASALLFLEEPSPSIDGVLTGKLFEYLYSPTPILAVGVDNTMAAGQLIEEACAGKVCGTDEQVIEQAILELLQGRCWGDKNDKVISRYSRERQVDALAQLIEEVSHGTRI